MTVRPRPHYQNKAAALKAAQAEGRVYASQTPLPKRRFAPPRFRLLPITMMMLVLILGVKLKDVYSESMQLSEMLSVPNAYAEDKPKADAAAKDEAKAKDASPADAMKDDKADAAKDEKTDEADAKDNLKNPEDVKLASLEKDPKPEADENHQYSQIEVDILQNLKKRREELDKQAAELDMKEKLLDATELRVNDKLSEMKSLKAEVDKLLEEYNKQEDNKLQGLVKIYENMKPKDAAQIFNELDMPILLEVVDRMSERKVSPVLAGMDPMKAKELTVQLAEYRKLKAVPRTVGSAQ